MEEIFKFNSWLIKRFAESRKVDYEIYNEGIYQLVTFDNPLTSLSYSVYLDNKLFKNAVLNKLRYCYIQTLTKDLLMKKELQDQLTDIICQIIDERTESLQSMTKSSSKSMFDESETSGENDFDSVYSEFLKVYGFETFNQYLNDTYQFTYSSEEDFTTSDYNEDEISDMFSFFKDKLNSAVEVKENKKRPEKPKGRPEKPRGRPEVKPELTAEEVFSELKSTLNPQDFLSLIADTFSLNLDAYNAEEVEFNWFDDSESEIIRTQLVSHLSQKPKGRPVRGKPNLDFDADPKQVKEMFSTVRAGIKDAGARDKFNKSFFDDYDGINTMRGINDNTPQETLNNMYARLRDRADAIANMS